ncbi:MAG: hypothetical protein KME54_25800 [Tolypothrix brevis GSE-NOS-MK-07-07A]|jgi:hypothetical protein|nr:hypothetical protein [Tolypothrix brevis GSE-NOS-MK-07-07A]
MFRKSMLVSFGLGWSLLNCGIAQALPNPIAKPNLVAQSYDDRPSGPAFGNVRTRGAVVLSNGTLARSLGAISSSLLDTGAYEVEFPQDVSNCIYNATLGEPGLENPETGEIVVGLRRGNPNAVFVGTFNSSGESANKGFHLTVTCPVNRGGYR